MMRFGRCLSTIFGEENFCIKKISVSCLRACRGEDLPLLPTREKRAEAGHNLTATLCQDRETLIEWSHTPYGGDYDAGHGENDKD